VFENEHAVNWQNDEKTYYQAKYIVHKSSCKLLMALHPKGKVAQKSQSE